MSGDRCGLCRSIRRRIIRTGATKRESSVASQAPLCYVNVNSTSLDHLPLGRNDPKPMSQSLWGGKTLRFYLPPFC
jgi:hypothetical protein